MKFSVLVLIKLVNENKQHSLCIAKGSNVALLTTPRWSRFSFVGVLFSVFDFAAHWRAVSTVDIWLNWSDPVLRRWWHKSLVSD